MDTNDGWCQLLYDSDMTHIGSSILTVFCSVQRIKAIKIYGTTITQIGLVHAIDNLKKKQRSVKKRLSMNLETNYNKPYYEIISVILNM